METDPVVERLYGTTDAAVWAEEFVKIVKGGADPTDEGFMVCWFANAMCVAEDHARQRLLRHLGESEGADY